MSTAILGGSANMHTFYLSRAEVRAFDKHAIETLRIPCPVLMENAGRGAAEILRSFYKQGLIILCCGKGNNGGDGLVMARHLTNWIFEVVPILFSSVDELTPDAKLEWHIIDKMGLEPQIWSAASCDDAKLAAIFADADWVVDALFGTGLTGPVRAPLDRVIDAINLSGKRILAVDIPSGLDCDTGEPLGATIRAEHTVTFVAQKLGFKNPASTNWPRAAVDIGITHATARSERTTLSLSCRCHAVQRAQPHTRSTAECQRSCASEQSAKMPRQADRSIVERGTKDSPAM